MPTMQHCGHVLPFSVVGIRPVGLKAVPDGTHKCLHSASGLAVLFRPPAGSGHIGPHYLSKTVGPVWPRPVSVLSYLRTWRVIGSDVQGKIIIF